MNFRWLSSIALGVAMLLLWSMPPRRRRRRKRGNKPTIEQAAWAAYMTPNEIELANEKAEQQKRREARRRMERQSRALRRLLRRRPQLIHSKQGHRRRPGRGLKSALGVVLITTTVILLLSVAAGMAGVQPISTYTDRFLPFTRAQQPAPHPAVAVAVATDTPAPTVTITSVPPASISTIASTPSHPSDRHLALKLEMLELVNQKRAEAGAPAVELGSNPAAQLHAENALDACVGSHWDVYGTKPYMRFTLVGGHQSNAENGHGTVGCPRPGANYSHVSQSDDVKGAVEGWMKSSGHRRTMLDPLYNKLNIGLAWSEGQFYAFQQFEGDYVEFDVLPTIGEGGILRLSGTATNGANFVRDNKLYVGIYYDPPLKRLTPAQLDATYCVPGGVQVAAIRAPLSGGSSYTSDSFLFELSDCVDPYELAENGKSIESRPDHNRALSVPWFTASVWDGTGKSFDVAVDISKVLEKHGDGVYTVILHGNILGTPGAVAEYSIFRGVNIPAVYDGWAN